jgi:hypothetical protein
MVLEVDVTDRRADFRLSRLHCSGYLSNGKWKKHSIDEIGLSREFQSEPRRAFYPV